MIIESGIQPNCSELVYQICGVTKDVAEKMKEKFISTLAWKYKKDYLENYASAIFAIPGKYNLNLYTYEGGEHIPDWDVLEKIAASMGFVSKMVGCCSDAIDTDERMEAQLEIKDEN